MSDRVVLDSGVAAKWFLNDEPDTDLAEDILRALLADELEVHVPQLFLYEFANVLSKACRHGLSLSAPTRITKEQAMRAISQLFRLPIHIAEPTEGASSAALEMSVDYHKSHYDMTYVHLANKLDCVWCTADQKVLRETSPGFPTRRILMLASLRDAPELMP